MNYARLALAAVAATIFDAVYGFVVYGMLLAPEFGRYPGVYRSNEAGMAFLPLMFAGLFVAIVAVAVIYAKGYEGAAARPKAPGSASCWACSWSSRSSR